jgi:tRNA threonylcarbamoyladenosine modification (KEOPS) complex Cgi121 subunit
MVQRTNNISERFFRGVKRFLRRITGKKKLKREVNALGDQALVIFNLKTPAYVKLICGSLDNLAQAFAELSQKGELTGHGRKPSAGYLDRKTRRSRDLPDQVKALFSSHELGSSSRV